MAYWHGYVVPSQRRELRTVDRTYTVAEWAEVMERSGWRVR